jgi:hypothetical protein
MSSNLSTNITSRDINPGVSIIYGNRAQANKSVLEMIEGIEETLSIYLYPCLIEYSLISMTVFFIMWQHVGKKEGDSHLRFAERHTYTVNCSRASRGLLVGGIIFLLTIISLILTYLVREDVKRVTQTTELLLLVFSLIFVSASFVYTSKLHYDPHAHVDAFDRALILITTVGDFAYVLFGLFASLLIEEKNTLDMVSLRIEVCIGFVAIVQIFLQTGFILDALKRCSLNKSDVRNKHGRETVTALLMANLGQ